jgi:zinc D-Ala-D-Ala carboxypeptidase
MLIAKLLAKKKIVLAVLLIILLSPAFSGCGFFRVTGPEDAEAEEKEVFPVGEQEDEQTLPDQTEQEEEEAGDEPDEGSPHSDPSSADDSGQPPSTGSGNQAQSNLLVISDGDYLLALVIKDTTLKSDYVPSGLKPVPGFMNPSYSMQLRQVALDHLEALWRAADSDGVTLHIRSAYRSYATQKTLFQDYANRYGEEQANRFSARPGQSEHQLGTTVDFGGTGVDFKADFAYTPQGLWLAENAHRFGFAMSYPEGKEHITGYIFEPWHYRYIGIDAALEWKSSGLTLREFLENKAQFYE